MSDFFDYWLLEMHLTSVNGSVLVAEHIGALVDVKGEKTFRVNPDDKFGTGGLVLAHDEALAGRAKGYFNSLRSNRNRDSKTDTVSSSQKGLNGAKVDFKFSRKRSGQVKDLEKQLLKYGVHWNG